MPSDRFTHNTAVELTLFVRDSSGDQRVEGWFDSVTLELGDTPAGSPVFADGFED